MFFCGISGAAPLHPVVSAKSGHVYEKELIEKYIAQDGKDPITGEGLTKEDLIDVIAKPSTLPPRPHTQTSIPSLLTALQSEYDSIMLESVEIKRAYGLARQELANALYREDAATRAIARLLKERDEARQALASIQSTIGYAAPAQNGDGDVQMDEGAAAPAAEPTLTVEIEEIVASTHASLSATRKKRKPAAGYASSDTVRSYTQTTTIPSLHATKPAGISALDLSADGSLVLTGGADKTVQVFDLAEQKTLATLKGHTKAVNQVAFVEGEGARHAVSAGQDKTLRVWKEEGAKWSLSHNFHQAKGDVVGFSVHPSKKMVAAASADSTWSLYDLAQLSTVKTYSPVEGIEGDFAYTSFTGHPDGVLHAGGTKAGAIRVWDVRDASTLAGTLDGFEGQPINSLSFSENGYYLATSSSATPTVKVFDLRKLALLSSWTLPAENKITEVRFDPSAQFLGVAGTDCRVYANKSWDELLKFDDNAGELTGARFGPLGGQIVLSGMDRTLRVLGPAAA